MSVVVDLDAPEAADPAVAGAKGAWLARARASGLPVRPGFLVPAERSRAPLARGAALLGERGSGRARLTLAAEPLEPELEGALVAAGRRLGGRLVARSSSLLEAGGEWAGGFTSYLDVRPEDLPTAVRGCWASVFTVDALGRAEAAGVEPGAAPMAILVQPFVDAEAGGAARMEGGDVVIIGVRGAPVSVLQGWEPGVVARVDEAGSVTGAAALATLGAPLLATVADLLRDATAATGATAMEWAVEGGSPVILQLTRTPRPVARVDAVPDPVLGTPPAAAIARLVALAPGPLGERLVLPWAIASPDSVVAALLDDGDAASRTSSSSNRSGGIARLLAAVRSAADGLAARAWAREPAGALEAARDTLAGLRGDAPGRSLETIAALHPIPASDEAACVAALRALQDALVAGGVVARWVETWYVAPEQMNGGPARPARLGSGPWEPFLAAVAIAAGSPTDGMPASAGTACGRPAWVPDPRAALALQPRGILVAPRPLPHLAPLLWEAAGLVTLGGGPGAHLFESARALGIPAVCGVDGDALAVHGNGGPVLVALDGSSGRVWSLTHRRPIDEGEFYNL